MYAEEAGSAAAPTAGLHFTPELLARLDIEYVTLHVGLDTFRPVAVDDLAEHTMHGERYAVRPQTWTGSPPPTACWPSARRRFACSSRSREGLRSRGGRSLFITPGFQFQRVDALLTNFHLPRSTLLALVMAFAGRTRPASSTARRLPSGTASTRSAMRCSSSQRHVCG